MDLDECILMFGAGMREKTLATKLHKSNETVCGSVAKLISTSLTHLSQRFSYCSISAGSRKPSHGPRSTKDLEQTSKQRAEFPRTISS